MSEKLRCRAFFSMDTKVFHNPLILNRIGSLRQLGARALSHDCVVTAENEPISIYIETKSAPVWLRTGLLSHRRIIARKNKPISIGVAHEQIETRPDVV